MDHITFRLSSQTPRLGEIFQLSESRIIKTPAVVAYSRKGLPVHLTPDNVSRSSIDLVHTSLEHFLDHPPPSFSHSPVSLAKHFGIDSQIIFMGVRDPQDYLPLPHNQENSLNVRTRRGIKRLFPHDYVQYMLENPPHFLVAMADEPTHRYPGRNRLDKSMKRSISWLEGLVSAAQKSEKQLNIIATMVGGGNPLIREAFSNTLANADGQVHLDRHLVGYCSSLTNIRGPEMQKLLDSSFAPLPTEKLRMVNSPRGPHEILRLIIDNGIDLFVDTYTSHLSSVGVALMCTLPKNDDASNSISDNHHKKPIGLNLYDPIYSRNFTTLKAPLKSSAAPPTIAYIHHLLHTHEMSAHVLLAMHNTLVMDQFMQDIRSVLTDLGVERLKECHSKFEKLFEDPSLKMRDESVLTDNNIDEIGISTGDYTLSDLAAWERNAIISNQKIHKERGKGPSSKFSNVVSSPNETPTPSSLDAPLQNVTIRDTGTPLRM